MADRGAFILSSILGKVQIIDGEHYLVTIVIKSIASDFGLENHVHAPSARGPSPRPSDPEVDAAEFSRRVLPRQTTRGVVHTTAKCSLLLDSARLGIEGHQIVPENPTFVPRRQECPPPRDNPLERGRRRGRRPISRLDGVHRPWKAPPGRKRSKLKHIWCKSGEARSSPEGSSKPIATAPQSARDKAATSLRWRDRQQRPLLDNRSGPAAG